MKNIDEVKWALDHCPQYTDECTISIYSKCPYKESTECIRDVAEDALAHLEQMQSERCERCEWISVKDRLPKVTDDNIVEVIALYQCYNYHWCRTMMYFKGHERIKKATHTSEGFLDPTAVGDAIWFASDDGKVGITHWMYPPKLPEEVENA